LFTEYCAKGDLYQFTATAGPPNLKLNVKQGVQVFSQIAQALLYIHHGISLTLEGVPCMEEIRTARVNGASPQDGDWNTILHRDIKPQNGQ
jgi:serine/threonine protein kinase